MKFSVPATIKCVAIAALIFIAAVLSLTRFMTLLLILFTGLVAMISSGCFKRDRRR